jgi:RNA-binding protein
MAGAMELSGKQVRFLKARGQRLDVSVHVGKAGLSEPLVEQVRSLLGRHELVKVKLPVGDAADRAESAGSLAEATSSTLVSVLGRNALLYRPNADLKEPIPLPL